MKLFYLVLAGTTAATLCNFAIGAQDGSVEADSKATDQACSLEVYQARTEYDHRVTRNVKLYEPMADAIRQFFDEFDDDERRALSNYTNRAQLPEQGADAELKAKLTPLLDKAKTKSGKHLRLAVLRHPRARVMITAAGQPQGFRAINLYLTGDRQKDEHELKAKLETELLRGTALDDKGNWDVRGKKGFPNEVDFILGSGRVSELCVNWYLKKHPQNSPKNQVGEIKDAKHLKETNKYNEIDIESGNTKKTPGKKGIK